MKIKLLVIGLLGLVSATAFAQKGELKSAQENYDAFTVSNTQKLLAAKAVSSLSDAKTSVDKASANDKTAALPQTYALKGAIYSALAVKDSVPATADPLLTTARESIKKAKDADTKGEFKKLIDDANLNIAIYYNALGVKQYQAGKFDLAYQSFDNWNQVKSDTSSLYYSGLAASLAGGTNPKYYPYAITAYKALLTTNFSENNKVYNYLASLYITTKDTVTALKILNTGIAKYPSNPQLRELQVRAALQSGKEKEVMGKLDSAITNDPKNKLLYFYKGYTYTRLGDGESDKASKTKDAAAKNALKKVALDYYSKSADGYKKALEIDPEYFDAALNLGSSMMKPAIDYYNEASNLPTNATQKQYDDLRLKADEQFDLAKPYLQKAADLNPNSKDALFNLRNYYKGKYDKAHAAENKAKADDLTKQINALPAAKQ